MYKRLLIATILGALLGVFCILGARMRYDNTLENTYLFSFWFNRLLMGVMIGLIAFKANLPVKLIRGLIIGLFVSFAFYSSTNYLDLTGFLAGGVYGIIIEFVLHFTIKQEKITN